jgi:hypothetical protein
MVVKQEALSDYNVYAQEFLKRTVWSDNCRAWYKSGKAEGSVTGVYQGSTLHYKGKQKSTVAINTYLTDTNQTSLRMQDSNTST